MNLFVKCAIKVADGKVVMFHLPGYDISYIQFLNVRKVPNASAASGKKVSIFQLAVKDGTMCLDESYRWRLADAIAWLRTRGLHSVPNSIKADIGDLVYNGPRSKAPDNSAALAPPPGRFVFNAGGRASNDPPAGL